MPMITGQKGIKSSRQARFQIVNMISTMKPLTKSTRQVVSTATIPTLVREAFRTAMEERPGPVHLELPEDMAGDEAPDLPMVPPHEIELPVAHPVALDRAAAMILAAKRPLVMLGAGASRPRLAAGLNGFFRRLQLPFFTTQMGKGSVAGGSNLYMGTAALSERDYVHKAIDRADLILAIGHDTIEKPPFLMGPGGPKVIHVGYTPASVEQVYFPDAEVVGDVGPSFALLADRLEGRLPPESPLLPLRQDILAHITNRNDESRFPPTPQRIVRDVRKVMPEDGIVCLDNGMYKIWFARNYRTRVANTLLLDNALATMGAGPSAMMASLLYPDRRVMAVCGDGGFMMNSQELETAVRLKLKLVVLILEDSAYGMIRWKQAIDGFADWGRRGLWRARRPGRGDRGPDNIEDAFARANALPWAFQAGLMRRRCGPIAASTPSAVMLNDHTAFRVAALARLRPRRCRGDGGDGARPEPRAGFRRRPPHPAHPRPQPDQPVLAARAATPTPIEGDLRCPTSASPSSPRPKGGRP